MGNARNALQQGEELAGDALYPDASYRVYGLLIERGHGTFDDYVKRAEAAHALGIYIQALSDCQQVVADPNSEKNVPTLVRALNLLAWIRATCPDEGIRNGAEAVQHAARALRVSPNDEWLNDTLAAAHAEAGNFPEAMEAQKRAMSATRDEQLLAEYRQRLDLYEANTPFREAARDSSTSV